MSLPVLNLAHRPFLNRKPVKRAQRILWALIALLLVVNGLLYWRNREDSSDLRDRASEVRRGITDESIVLGQLQDQLGELDPERQNARVDFLNLKIAERTFPWGRLFDRLSSILPPMVRLRTLDPSVGQNSISRSGAPGEETVLLAINGVAASDSDLYALIDGFFGHPAFEEPKLRSERTNDNGEVGFSMTVRYHPWIEEPESSVAESPSVDQEAAAR